MYNSPINDNDITNNRFSGVESDGLTQTLRHNRISGNAIGVTNPWNTTSVYFRFDHRARVASRAISGA